jgi:hypothetical protein
VAVQLFVPGLYLRPVLVGTQNSILVQPPQTIISLPVHTAVCLNRPKGALVVLVSIQVSVFGLYRPPVLVLLRGTPPQTIISLPVHTAV